MKKTEKIDAELVELALAMCRTNHAAALSRREEVDLEISKWEHKIEKYEKLTTKNRPANGVPNGLRTRTGRIPHGRSEQLITRFLQSKNGAGVKISEIVSSVGTKYPTTHRLIKILERRGEVKKGKKSRWLLIAK